VDKKHLSNFEENDSSGTTHVRVMVDHKPPK